MAAVLLRAQRCSRCGRLSRRVFTVGTRYICDRDPCVIAWLNEHQPELDEAQIRALLPKLRAHFLDAK